MIALPRKRGRDAAEGAEGIMVERIPNRFSERVVELGEEIDESLAARDDETAEEVVTIPPPPRGFSEKEHLGVLEALSVVPCERIPIEQGSNSWKLLLEGSGLSEERLTAWLRGMEWSRLEELEDCEGPLEESNNYRIYWCPPPPPY